jgi:hypothetical protein
MLLTAMRDLTDPERVKDADHQLRRAERAGEVALAAWAKEWGAAAVDILHDRAGEDVDDEDQLDDIRGTLVSVGEEADRALVEIDGVDLADDEAVRQALKTARARLSQISEWAGDE